MKPTPLVPALPEEGDGPRWGLAASAVGHGLVLLVLLGFFVTRRLPPDGGGSPSYDLVFEGPSGGAPSSNAPEQQKLPPAQPADISPPPDALPGPPAPTPLSTPDPNAATAPPPAADAAPPPAADAVPIPVPDAVPSPAPRPAPTPAQTAQPAPVTAAPPPVVLAVPNEAATIPLPTPLEVPPTLEQPAVRLELPQDEPAPAASAPIMPQPLPPVEPRPRPTRQAARPRPALGSLSNPMDLSLGPAAPRPAARSSVASRSLDLSPPQGRDGPATSDPYAQIRAANASADWNRGLLQYWLQHRFYPEQARANGEQGAVTIQLTVNRSGRVESVEVLSRSGSQWLDMAALSTWRGARLPPFTNEMREDRITFPIPIQYYLIR